MFPKNISKMKKNIPMNKFIIMFKYIPAILATLLNIMTVHVHAQERWCKQKASKRIKARKFRSVFHCHYHLNINKFVINTKRTTYESNHR